MRSEKHIFFQTHYNVVFFDTVDVTRAWIAPVQMKPYSINKKTLQHKDKKYKKRIEIAITQADSAEKLPLHTRLAKYSFIARYSGSVNKPRKLSKHDLRKYQNKLKRKYNIAYPDDSSEESNEAYETGERVKVNKTIMSAPKRPKEKTSNIAKKYKPIGNMKAVQVSNASDINSEKAREEGNESLVQVAMNEDAKQADSIAVQVGSTVPSAVTDCSPDNGINQYFSYLLI